MFYSLKALKHAGVQVSSRAFITRSIIASSPLDQDQLVCSRTLNDVALRRDATPIQVALAWLVRRKGVIGSRLSDGPQPWSSGSQAR